MKDINIRLIKKFLPRGENRILDAGCGAGAALPYLSQFGNAVGIDASSDAVRYAKTIGKAMKGNIMHLPFKNETFDMVFCFGVLYHRWVIDDNVAIAEFRRVLKKGGFLYSQEPAYHWLMGNEDEISQGKHRYTLPEMQKKLKQKKFKILKATYVNTILLPLAILRRLPNILGFREKKKESDIFTLPPIVNALFYIILRIEGLLLQYVNFPHGMSIICIAKK